MYKEYFLGLLWYTDTTSFNLFKTIVSILDINKKQRLMIGNKPMWCFCLLLDSLEASLCVSTAVKPLMLGMAMGRVRAEFFHTQTRPAGLSPRPKPTRLLAEFFSRGPNPPPLGPVGLVGLVKPYQIWAQSVAQIVAQPKKKKKKKELNGHCPFLCTFFSF